MVAEVNWVDAKEYKTYLRLAIAGIAKAGKSMTALAVAKGMREEDPSIGEVAVACSERGSAAKYAKFYKFKLNVLTSFHPDRYIEAIDSAERRGFGICILDGISQCWGGKDGVLETKDKVAGMRGSNPFDAWRTASPLHNRFVDRILESKMHIICTMRSKTSYVIEPDDNGKHRPRKIGLEPVQRDNISYEFDLLGEIDEDHTLTFGGTRCYFIDHISIQAPPKLEDGRADDQKMRTLGRALANWTNQGEKPPTDYLAGIQPTIPDGPISDHQKKVIHTILSKISPPGADGKARIDPVLKDRIYEKFHIASSLELDMARAAQLIEILNRMRRLQDEGGDMMSALD